MNYLCIDLGGTKTLICIVSEDGTISTEVRFETPEHYPDFLDKLTDEISKLPEQFTTAVMSVPGLINQKAQTIVALGNRPWTDLSLVADVQQRTGISLRILNDARLAGLAEARHLQDLYERCMYITLSTGIGIALAVNGELVHELDDTEAGKMPVLVDGKLVPWEEVASGRAIYNKYNTPASDITDPTIWQEVAQSLILGIGPLCATLQPDAIVLGGGMGQYADRFSHFILEELQRILHPVVMQPKAILASHYKDQAVIYGCLELAKGNDATTS